MSAAQTIKCVVVGDGMIGKTSLLMRYTSEQFPMDYVPTVFDNMSKTVMVDGTAVYLSLWDTAGQEGYDRLRLLAYPQTNVFVLCFSLVNSDSLYNLQDKWMPEIKKHCDGVPVILVGTKHDLRENENSSSSTFKLVSYQNGRSMQKHLGAAAYVECSALTGKNVREVFEEAIRASLRQLADKGDINFRKFRKKKCSIL